MSRFMGPSRGLRLCAASIIFLAIGATLWAFTYSGSRWPRGSTVTMHLQLGPTPRLSDLCTQWNECFQQAMALWQPYVDLRLATLFDSAAPIGEGNGRNNVIFSDDVFGQPFDERVLAITVSYRIDDRRVESDVVFNRRESWDAYRGTLRTEQEFRRVAAHEFGHVLGLGHPNDQGQRVDAIMNGVIGNLETLTADDIAGARGLYVTSPAPPSGPALIVEFPPRDQSLAFRSALETKYASGLGRGPGPTFVDNEGSVVWTQEYLRYRVNQCSHPEAVQRVTMQIDGFGIQPVCGFATGTTVVFPPRDQSLDFRTQLEAKYRDGLRRAPASSAVDQEGDLVWTQEYLRYRVNGCGHEQAVARVFAQIDGAGVQPTCR